MAGEDHDQVDNQSIDNDGMDELFGDDADSGAADQPAEYEFSLLNPA